MSVKKQGRLTIFSFFKEFEKSLKETSKSVFLIISPERAKKE